MTGKVKQILIGFSADFKRTILEKSRNIQA